MEIIIREEIEHISKIVQEEISLKGESFLITNKVYLQTDNYEEKFVGMIISPLDEYPYIERFLPCNEFFELSFKTQKYIKIKIKKYFEEKFDKDFQYKIIELNNDIIVKKEIPLEFL